MMEARVSEDSELSLRRIRIETVSESMAVRGYMAEKPATQCEGRERVTVTLGSCDRSYQLHGHDAQIDMLSLLRSDCYILRLSAVCK